MKIRKIKIDDINYITKLYLELLNHNLRFVKYLENKKNKINKNELKESLKKRINQTKNKVFLVAEKGDKIYGFVQAEIMSNKKSRTKNKVVEIIDIYVHSKKKGTGKMLLSEIEKWARTKKANYILWEFMSGNNIAENFCIKNKFKHFKTKMLKKIK